MTNIIAHVSKLLFLFCFIALFSFCTNAQTEKKALSQPAELPKSVSPSSKDTIPKEVQRLITAYPNHVIGYADNHVVFADSTVLLFDDGKEKPFAELADNADIEDMFIYSYPKGHIEMAKKKEDPGRIRNDALFKKMYGSTSAEVHKKLTTITWCPKLTGQKLQITTENGVDVQLLKISEELDEHPEWKQYLISAGTFNWRVISGTKRLSGHSFGIAIDLNTAYSNYWQWDCGCKNENAELRYHNKMPQGIVDIFEKHGFIWGGKWYHYDTMHFEYRPELLK